MEFNLRKVLKTLLLSTAEPVSIKDIQAVIARHHEQREKDAARDVALNGPAGEPDVAPDAPAPDASETAPDFPKPEQDELRLDDPDTQQRVIRDIIDQVPTLLTATQIREAMDALNAEMAETGEVTRILQGPEGFRLVIAPSHAEWVRLLRNDPKPRRFLSQGAIGDARHLSPTGSPSRAPRAGGAARGFRRQRARAPAGHRTHPRHRSRRPSRQSHPIRHDGEIPRFLRREDALELPASDVLTPAQINEWIARATNPPPSPETPPWASRTNLLRRRRSPPPRSWTSEIPPNDFQAKTLCRARRLRVAATTTKAESD